MSDQVQDEVVVGNAEDQAAAIADPFSEESWSDTAPEVKQPEIVEEKKEEVVQEVKQEEKKEDVKEEILDANEYLKSHFGHDNLEAAKAEFEELRKLKGQTPAEIKFENEESKKYFEAIAAGKEDEIFSILATKKQIEKANKLDVTNPKDAAELIKTTLQLKHKDLEAFEVHDIFEEQYSKPAKPVQTLEQTDEEHETQLAAWKVRCDAIDRKIVRDAKLAKPELDQLTSKLVLPEIPKQETPAPTQPQPTQEELAEAKRLKDSFVESAQKSLNEFKGFSATVKDKDVEIPVSYDLSQEEKAFVDSKVKAFADTNFNVNSIFADRWVNEDGSVNSTQMTKDLSMLYYGEKASQKFASDAAAKRLEAYLKEKKNIDVNVTSTRETFAPNNTKSEQEKLADHFFTN